MLRMTLVTLNLKWTKLPKSANLEKHHREMAALCELPIGAVNYRIPWTVSLLYSVWLALALPTHGLSAVRVGARLHV